MKQQTIELGISTCPNDTFTFHALMHRLVDWRGLDFRVHLHDIQELNDSLFRGKFDVAKTSFHAALLLADQTMVLPTGAALGFGVGPLLLSSSPQRLNAPTDPQQIVLCPGRHTTASLLFKLFYRDTATVRQCVFSEIMPRLKRGEADYGVCIHEGRFTWETERLGCVVDLGTQWESETHCPLPLGGLVARRSLPAETIATIQSVVEESLRYALADRSSALPTMRRYAQFFDDDILMQHVDLYVNEWTVNLGEIGGRALSELSNRAAAAGIQSRGIEVFCPGKDC
ncbi:menaquinone biosynthesis family protein [Novipirellula artificiosorum]|uniref:1,4-dihydroxy-6-naphtoate synthase n=1 Tax=Novipirellula artificiosorum TaxID=2528016 RepID=A0A5C6DW30_9BACT|nr:1,4-dihydroxy-6-naphthoate synthase [Novipirellula artificiosorum]TWU40454.1 1,4-dihydroxy-6-naphtoate synthase [Novipirellula artificiosorum]